MNDKPEVYVIILNWNRAADTEECINSVLSQDYKNFKIILVDNGSTEPGSILLGSKFTDIIFIRNEENLGYAGGNNTGLWAAFNSRANYVLILNNDVAPDRLMLSELIKAAESHPETGVFAPINYEYGNPLKVISSGGEIFWTLGRFNVLSDIPDNIRETEHVAGSAFLIRREVLEKTEWLDSEFFAYCEETDWMIRIKKAGFGINVVPSAKVYHKLSASTGGKQSPLSIYYWTRNRLYLMKKNAGIFNYTFFILFILPLIILRNLWRWRSDNEKEIFFLKGLLDFFKSKTGKYENSH